MKTLYLHIGAHKTATTFLQRSLYLNSAQFAEHGIDTLPDLTVAKQGHHNIPFSYMKWPLRAESLSHEQYRAKFLARLHDSKMQSLILSSEYFEVLSREALNSLSADLADFNKVVIYWIRNQTQYLESFYLGTFKGGATASFDEWTKRAPKPGNYFRVLRWWSKDLPVRDIRIVIYDNLALAKADIFEYFAREIMGLPASQELARPEKPRLNEAASARMLWLLIEMNRRYNSSSDQPASGSAEYRRMYTRLEKAFYATASLNKDLTRPRILDAEQEKAIEDKFAAPNEHLIKEFGSRIRNPTPGALLFPKRAAADGAPETSLGPKSIEVPELLDLMYMALSGNPEPNEDK